MRTEQRNVQQFHLAMGQQDPQTPTMPGLPTRILRAKLILEEAIEMVVDGLGVDVVTGTTTQALRDIRRELRKPDAEIFEIHPGSLTEIADGIADLKYVANGTALACGIDMEPVDDEVQRSNLSKFIDGHRRADGKWQKGPSYSPTDIARILSEQAIPLPDPSPAIKTPTAPTSGNGGPLPIILECGSLAPADYSFDAINEFVHHEDVHFEDLQNALLGMAAAAERKTEAQEHTQVSACCKAAVWPGSITEDGKRHYLCRSCGQPCELI